jgi:hypothetical protein
MDNPKFKIGETKWVPMYYYGQIRLLEIESYYYDVNENTFRYILDKCNFEEKYIFNTFDEALKMYKEMEALDERENLERLQEEKLEEEQKKIEEDSKKCKKKKKGFFF